MWQNLTAGVRRIRGQVIIAAAALAMVMPAVPATAAADTAATPTVSAVASAFPTVTLNQVTSSAGFVHPGIDVSAPNLLLARQEVLNGVEPWSSYYAAMLDTNYASKTLTPVNHSTQVDTPGTVAFNSQGVEAQFIADAFGAYPRPRRRIPATVLSRRAEPSRTASVR
jgi:hypothetical protein